MLVVVFSEGLGIPLPDVAAYLEILGQDQRMRRSANHLGERNLVEDGIAMFRDPRLGCCDGAYFSHPQWELRCHSVGTVLFRFLQNVNPHGLYLLNSYLLALTLAEKERGSQGWKVLQLSAVRRRK